MSTLPLYKEMHLAGAFPGHSTKKNSESIKSLIQKYKAEDLMDYGCGKGLQYIEGKLHEEWGIPFEKIRLYDPAVPGLDKGPGGFECYDGVICCDVLEHLEGHELRECIFNVTLRARKFAFFSIATFPAKKRLPDGRNAHLTIMPREWWAGHVMASMFPHTSAEVVLRFDHGDERDANEGSIIGKTLSWRT